MEKITFDKRNYRRHDEKNKRVIRKSLDELGGRLVVGSQLYPLNDRLKQICAENGYDVRKSDMQIITNNSLHGTEDDKIDSLFIIKKQ